MKQKPSLWQSVVGIMKDNSPFMSKVGKAALLAELNLCLVLTCLPIITAGAAVTALYTALFQFSELTYGSVLKVYFRAFRQAFRPTLPALLLTLVTAAGLGAGWYIVLFSQLTDNFLIMLPLLLSSVVVLFTLCWLYPLYAVSLLENSIPALKDILSASLLIGLRELLRSFGAALLMLLPDLLLLWVSTQSLTLMGIWVLFGISPFALLHSKIVNSVISRTDKE
jgi:hypothetical protein